MSADNNARMGWQCPVCGRGVSPFSFVCTHGGEVDERRDDAAITKVLEAGGGAMGDTGPAPRKSRVKYGTSKGRAHQLPKGTLKRWALSQDGPFTTDMAMEGIGTSIGAASQGLRLLSLDGLLLKIGKGRWEVTSKGRKEAAKTPTGAWTR